LDLVKQLGPLALASRLKRLSERLLKDGAAIYKSQGIDFQPRWFPVLYLLNQKSPMIVTAVANSLGMTHPSVNQIASAMTKAGLLKSFRDKNDERRRLLALTSKGKKMAADLKPVWQDFNDAAAELLENAGREPLDIIDRIEQELDRQSMFDRITKRIKKRQMGEVDIIDYDDNLKQHFKALNYEWLKKYFTVETQDRRVLADPGGEIVSQGGYVFFARLDGKIIGTAALLKHDKKTYELAKMAVAKKAQGRQAGKKLALTAIETARNLGADKVILETSPELDKAVHLYKNLGFAEYKPNSKSGCGYNRCSIQMKLVIKKNKNK